MTDQIELTGAHAPTVRAVIAAQPFLTRIGAKLAAVEPGFVEIAAAVSADWTRAEGVAHGGLVAALAEAAGEAAAISVAGRAPEALIEQKVSHLAPARGLWLIARGESIRSGGAIAACQADVYAVDEEQAETLVATALSTFLTMKLSAE